MEANYIVLYLKNNQARMISYDSLFFYLECL